ncbi:MAG: hypothetical protein MK102_01230 [Fuerstiella sp.]|nr:hypothetical protein [Fuerstiella sp.]
MERLTSLLIPALLICSVCKAHGQTFRFTIAGDVTNADTWEGSYAIPDEPVYLLDLLKKAGVQGEGQAVILSDESLQSAGSRCISAQMSANREQLKNGDIVIFHLISHDSRLTEHIVIIVGSQRHIVPLAEIDSRLGNLLTAAGVPVSANHTIPIIRTENGRAEDRSVKPWEVLRHGDVVLLDHLGILDNGGRVRVNQLFRSVLDPETRSVSKHFIQTVAEERDCQPVASAKKASEFNLNLSALSSRDSSLATETSGIPILPAAAESIISPDHPGQSQHVRTPVPHSDPNPDHVKISAAAPVWNGIFIFGLLGSVALILTGWLKTHRESSPVETQTTDSQFDLQSLQEISATQAPDMSASITHDTVDSASRPPELTTQEGSPSDQSPPSAPVTDKADPDDKPSSKVVNDLEDLIRNRIPIDIQQADLPLRVTLFGRPLGPRRLRIDAPHTRIDTPKFATVSRTEGTSPQKSSSTSSLDQERRDGMSLDRALNSLNEQGLS